MRFCISSKFEPFSFLLNSCSKIDHVSKFWISSLFLVRKFCISSKFEEKLNLRQKSIFEQEFNKKLNGSNFELIQNLMHIPSREKSSFDDFLSLYKIPPVIWKIVKWIFVCEIQYLTLLRPKVVIIECHLITCNLL